MNFGSNPNLERRVDIREVQKGMTFKKACAPQIHTVGSGAQEKAYSTLAY